MTIGVTTRPGRRNGGSLSPVRLVHLGSSMNANSDRSGERPLPSNFLTMMVEAVGELGDKGLTVVHVVGDFVRRQISPLI